jgi:hypothetical protein
MTIDQCEQLLQVQYGKNPTQGDNISQLTSKARPTNKAECLKTM